MVEHFRSRLRAALVRHVLQKALASQCGMAVPRSGAQGEAINCYSTRAETEDGKEYLLQGLAGDEVSALEWDGERFSVPTVVPLKTVASGKLTIRHYVGLASVTYTGFADAARGMVVRWPYVVLWVNRTWDRLNQALFNRRSLATARRHELLALVIDLAEESGREVSTTELMSSHYGGDRWAGHPQYWALLTRTEFHLDLLVDSGELVKRRSGGYWPTGTGMRVREEAEEQERRHRENVRVQVGLGIVALFAGVMAAAQANLIRLPTVIDIAPPTQAER